MRHTHDGLLLEAGADMKCVQERLEDGFAQISADIYAHVTILIASRLFEKFDEYMKQIE
ncbi:hypothetical protein [Paenisporosarcina indica]|uniref:hypothetical protein n=1 Tax=Paenisporosarcina indica TaxID=650093 RepID=UPI000A9C7AF5|nr:hypothetical protein [Paenisporosarcina indica]